MSIKTIDRQIKGSAGVAKKINKGAERMVFDILQSTQYSMLQKLSEERSLKKTTTSREVESNTKTVILIEATTTLIVLTQMIIRFILRMRRDQVLDVVMYSKLEIMAQVSAVEDWKVSLNQVTQQREIPQRTLELLDQVRSLHYLREQSFTLQRRFIMERSLNVIVTTTRLILLYLHLTLRQGSKTLLLRRG